MSRMRQFLIEHRWLLLIALLSLGIKGLFLLSGEVVNPDAATYIAAAEKHSQGQFQEGLRYYRMPFYPLLLAAVHSVVPNWIAAGRILTVLPLWLTLFPLYILTRRLFSKSAALWTALLFAVLPTFNTTCTSIKRDPLFLLFSVTALLFLVLFFQQHRKRQMVWFSAFAVCATLTRIEGVLLPVVAAGSAVVVGDGIRLRIKALVGLLAIPLMFVLAFWGLERVGIQTSSRLYEVKLWGERFLNSKLFAGYQHLMENLKTFQQTQRAADLHNNLIEVTRHYAPLIYVIGLLEMLLKGIFPTSVVALWALRWRNRDKLIVERRVLLLTWLSFLLLNVLFTITRNFTTERYLWLVILLTLPWIGEGISLWRQRYGKQRIVVWLVVGLVCVAPLGKSIAEAARFQDQTVVKAGLWLQHHDPLQQISVLYNDRRLPLYAERINDVFRVRSEVYLQRNAARGQLQTDLVVLYYSNKKNEKTTLPGFEPVKQFEGKRKTVVFLQRKKIQ